MRAIRIIRSVSPLAPDLTLVERDEQLRAVEQIITEALGPTSVERIQNCVDKLRIFLDTNDQLETTLRLIDRNIHTSQDALAVHGDLEISRILELLED